MSATTTDGGLLGGRVAVVTGAASGMGRVMARALAGAGAKIAAVDIDAEGLARLVTEPVFANTSAKFVADVSLLESCRHTVQQVLDTFGGLDILINCAGVGMMSASPSGDTQVKFQDTIPEGWLRILSINSGGAYLMGRFASEPMIKKGWGRIINITTSYDTMLRGGSCAYGASKSALEASTVSWADDLKGTGVTVNTLVPGGATDTNFFPAGVPKPPNLIDPQVMAVPVVWLASTASDGVTGGRFIARFWDHRLPPDEAAAKLRTSAGWPDLAQAALAQRGWV